MATLSEKILNLTLSNEKHSRDFESSIKDVQSQLDQVRLAKGQLEKQATTLQDLLFFIVPKGIQRQNDTTNVGYKTFQSLPFLGIVENKL